MKKQRYRCNFLGLDREVYESLVDCYLDHRRISFLKRDPVGFIVGFSKFTRDIPDEFKPIILQIAKSLVKGKGKSSIANQTICLIQKKG